MKSKFQIIQPPDTFEEPGYVNRLYQYFGPQIEEDEEREKRYRKWKASKVKTQGKVSNWVKLRTDLFGKTLKRKLKNKGENSEITFTELEIKKDNVLQELKKRFKPPTDISMKNEIGQFIGMSCGIECNQKDHFEYIVKITLVDNFGKVIYESLIRPPVKYSKNQIQYLKQSEDLLDKAPALTQVKNDVQSIISGKTLVGCNVKYQLNLLELQHPAGNIREILQHPLLKEANCGRKPTLKKIVRHLLGFWIEAEHHDTTEEAYASLAIFMMLRAKWNKKSIKHVEETNKKSQNNDNTNKVTKLQQAKPNFSDKVVANPINIPSVDLLNKKVKDTTNIAQPKRGNSHKPKLKGNMIFIPQ